MYRILLLTTVMVVVMCNRPLLAQESPRYSLSFSPVLGTHLLPENEHVFNDAIPGVDITYGFRLDGEENTWADLLNAREVGLSFSFRDFSRLAGHLDTSANSFGKAYGLAARMEFELGHAGPVHFYFVPRSAEHTSELQSLMLISYAVFCLKTKI